MAATSAVTTTITITSTSTPIIPVDETTSAMVRLSPQLLRILNVPFEVAYPESVPLSFLILCDTQLLHTITLVTCSKATSTSVTTTSLTATATVTAGPGGIYDENMPPDGTCGCEFSIYCGYGANQMNVERSLTTADYQGCVATCDSQNNCDYAVFNADTNTCSISTSYQGEAVQVADSVLIIKNNPGSCANNNAPGCPNL
jgi:hypothetical protein